MDPSSTAAPAATPAPATAFPAQPSAPGPAPAPNTSSSNSDNPRKRPRSTSPIPGAPSTTTTPGVGLSATPSSPPTPSSSTALLAANLKSTDPTVSVSALNTLLKLSADDRRNYALGEGGEDVVDGLVRMFDDAIGWTRDEDLPQGEDGIDDEQDDEDLTPSAETWTDKTTNTNTNTTTNTKANFCDGPSRHPSEPWPEFCTRRLSPPPHHTSLPSPTSSHPTTFVTPPCMSLLRNISLIVRNLSYVAQNVRYLSHSPDMLRVLTGCLYFRAFERNEEDDRGRAGGANNSNVCLFALHALMNLVPWLDPTGRKVFADRVLLDPSTSSDKALTEASTIQSVVRSVIPQRGYGQSSTLGIGGMLIAKKFEFRDESLSKVSDDVIRTLTGPHIRAVLALYPALSHSLHVTVNRAAVSTTLELMSSLVDTAENQAVFMSMPDAMLDRLSDLVYVPRLGPNSIEYVDPVGNTVSRVTTLKLLTGYDAAIDSELRDRSVELLVKLTGLGPDLKRRVGRGRRGRTEGGDGRTAAAAAGATATAAVAPTSHHHLPNIRLYDSLLPMLTTRTGRGDAPQLAARLLANLAVVPENAVGMMYVEGRVLDAAGKDANVANVVCNGVLNHVV